MATFTEHYNLIKPDEADYYDVSDFNENMDTLDAAMAITEQTISAVDDKIGTPATEGNTLFSLLEGNNGFIKSFQRVQFNVTSGSTTHTKALTTSVDPTKCIVLMDKLHDRTGVMKFVYTLNSNSIDLNVTNYDGNSWEAIVLFQVIELF